MKRKIKCLLFIGVAGVLVILFICVHFNWYIAQSIFEEKGGIKYPEDYVYGKSIRIDNLGPILYTSKSLGGLYYTYNDRLYLISGTENANGDQAQIYVYSIYDDRLVKNSSIDLAVSIMSFCDIGNHIYIGTIGRERDTGCDLYCLDKDTFDIKKIPCHFKEQGIYALSWDGSDTLWIATSNYPKLYSLSLESQSLKCELKDFTNDVFIRSMSYKDGRVYMGMGSNADLLSFDPLTGETSSLLPDEYRSNSFVYNMNILGDNLFFLLKNDLGIYRYSLSGNGIDRICNYQSGNVSPSMSDGNWCDIEGDLLFFDDNSQLVGHCSHNGIRAFFDENHQIMYSLSGSCILSAYSHNGECLYECDLSEELSKSYISPIEFWVSDDLLIFPWRRFMVWNLKNNEKKVSVIEDEPQASIINEGYVYTGNYPLCTVYKYPMDYLLSSSDLRLDTRKYIIADIDDQCRPSEMDISPDGKYLVMGSGPVYGKWGGAINVIDLIDSSLLYSSQNIVPYQSVRTVLCSKYYRDCVWVGTIPYGESTNPEYLDVPAHLVLWSIVDQKILKDIIINENTRKIIDIEEKDSKLYIVTVTGGVCEVYEYDYNLEEMIATNMDDGITDLLICRNGEIIGISYDTLYSLDANTLEGRIIVDGFYKLSNMRQDPITGNIYFFDNNELIKASVE